MTRHQRGCAFAGCAIIAGASFRYTGYFMRGDFRDAAIATAVIFGLAAVVHTLILNGTELLVRVLDHEVPAMTLRYVAVVLLVVGFHFDLLAS